MGTITTAPITVAGKTVNVAGGPWTLTMAAQFGLIIADNSGQWAGDQAGLYKLAWQPTNYVDTGPGSKFYDGGQGIAKAYSNLLSSGFGAKPHETACALCFKGPYDRTAFLATCRSALAKFPNSILRVMWEQESDRGSGSPPTVAAWQSMTSLMYADIQANSDLRGKVEIWISLTGYNQYETPRAGKQLENFIPNATVASQVGGVDYDVYQFQGKYWTQAWSPKPELDNMLNRAGALGLKMHIGEYGVTDLRPGGQPDSDAQRARRAQEAIDWCRAHGVGLNYYENYAGVDNTTTTGPVGLLKDHTSAAPNFPLTWAAVLGMLS